MRRELPTRRESWLQKVQIGGRTIHLGVSEFDDGQPAEVFLNVALADTDEDLRGWLSSFAIAVSIALQQGAQIEDFVRLFRGSRFGPSGPIVGSERVRGIASSILDWVFRELEAEYVAPAVPEEVSA